MNTNKSRGAEPSRPLVPDAIETDSTSAVEDESVIEMLVHLDRDPQPQGSDLMTRLDNESVSDEDEVRRAVHGLEILNRVRENSPHCIVDLAFYDGDGKSNDPKRIGKFEIIKRIGMGGFGVVFLARDPSIDRDVALKVPRVEALINETTRGRFLQESKAAALVSHPNVATIYEAGAVGPLCYIVSEYCEGGSIAALLDRLPEGRLPARAASKLIAAVSDAVECGHQQGVLHRDIKPTNLLLDATEEEVSHLVENPDELHERVKLVDFGLAKDLNRDDNRTRTGVLLGTPAYTAPEQIAQSHEIGVTADVYSLGATLYHLITGQPPLQKATDFASLVANQHEEPACPRTLHAEIRHDLSAICLKCLEKDPSARYASAADLADDLRRFVSGRPVVARRISKVRKLARMILRNRTISILAAISLLSVSVATTTVLVSLRVIQEEKVNAAELIRQLQDLNARRNEKTIRRAESHPTASDENVAD